MRVLKFISGYQRIAYSCCKCNNMQYFNNKYTKSLCKANELFFRYCSTSTSLAKDDTKLLMLASKVLDFNIKFDVMASCVPVGKISDTLKYLFRLGFSEKAAFDLLTKLGGWPIRQTELLQSILNIFDPYNLTPESMAAILENLPPDFKEERLSLKMLPGMFTSNLDGFTKLGFSDENIVTMLSTEPQVIFLKFEDCVDVMNKLNGLVDKCVKVTDLVVRCPNILTDDWEEVTAKFEYAYFKMGYELVDIARSSIFKHSFNYLKDRHVYLIRTGLFVTIKRKGDEKVQNPNPKLRSVLDSNDSQFAKMFGNLSKEEYSVYLAMRELERESEESERVDSESETS